jgi:hypothetical protein
VVASSEDFFADALGGAEHTLALVEEPKVTQAGPEPGVRGRDGGMVLDVMDLLMDFQRALEASAGAD